MWVPKFKHGGATAPERERLGIALIPFLFADSLRILLYFAAFCRAKLLKLFRIRALFWTLDQHIGVRIPGGQPINMLVPAIPPKIQSSVSVLCPYPASVLTSA